jgi:acetyl-CoA carboxylase biotin carboxyl carrier protein
MSDPVSLDDIKSIIKLVRDADNVAEFTLKYGDLEISLSRESKSGPSAAPSAAMPAAAPVAATRSEPPKPPAAENVTPASGPAPAPAADEVVITAPMVGTFYRSPKPGEPPFVEVGRSVEKDSVVCIIEIMKLMNSLEAGVAGTVTRILVEDAQAVEYGQPLIYVRKAG